MTVAGHIRTMTGESAERAALGAGAVVMDVMAEMAVPGDLTHVTDVKEIASYGLIGVPAVAINGKVVSSGIVPPKSRIRQWLQEAKEKASP